MMNFSAGDLIYFLDAAGKVAYGVCDHVDVNGSQITYVLTLPNSSLYYLDSSKAYPSGLLLATPTPTPSHSPSITPTRTPAATLTPTLTLSASVPAYPNLFAPDDAAAWSSTDGIISTENNGIIFTSNSNNPKSLLVFSRTFPVTGNKTFHFSFDFEQGTIRYAKIRLDVDQGLMFASSMAEVNNGNQLVFGLFGDSGRFETDLIVPSATTLTMTVSLYTDSNYNESPKKNFDYRLERTILRQQYSPNITATPTPTTSASKTPTPTPSVTPSLTPVHIPLSGYAKMVIADNPLVYYKFDETVGNAAIDYSGNSINGTYHNVVLGEPPIVDGLGYAAGFGGNTQPSYVVSNNDNRYKNVLTDFSFEVSVNGATQPHDSIIAWLPTTGNDSVFKLSVESGKIVFHLSTLSGNYTLNPNVSIVDGIDHLISGVRAGNAIKLYLDGILIGSTTVAGNNATSRNFIYVGGVVSNAAVNYTGIIDDFSYYRFALSDFQIQNHYIVWTNSGGSALTPTPTPSVTPGTDAYKSMIIGSLPVAYYRLDEPQGTYAYDSIGNKHNGISNGLLELQQPSLMLNYADRATGNLRTGVISVKQNSDDLSFSGSDFTFEFIIAASSTQLAATPTIFNKVVDATIPSYNYRFYLNSVGVGIFSVYMNGVATSISTQNPITDDMTKFIHIIRSGRTISLYVDNEFTDSATLGGSGILDTASSDFEMFSSSYVDGCAFMGVLDEFAIYNYGMSDAVRNQHFAKGNVVTPTPTPSHTRTASHTPTPTVTRTITITPSITTSISITPTISITPSVTPTISITSSITPTVSHSRTQTVTPTRTPASTVTPTATHTATPTVTPTISITPSVTASISITASVSLTPSVTPTISVTPSVTPTISVTPSVTASLSVTPSVTATVSFTPTSTITPTVTRSVTMTPTLTRSATPTVTPTHTVTKTVTPTPSITPTISVTVTRTYDPNAQVILNSLHNWWDFDEAANQNKVDAQDGVQLVPYNVTNGIGIIGNAVSFNPINNPTGRLESTLSENVLNYGNSDFTVGAFFKLNYAMMAQLDYDVMSIMARWSSNQRQFQLGYDKSVDKVFLSISDNGDNVATVYSTTTVNGATGWLAIVGSYDSGNHKIQISLNGAAPTVQSYLAGYYGVTQPFTIGNDGYQDSGFAGLIDSAFVCSKVLTAAQIAWYYNNGLGTDYNRVLANAYYVDKGALYQYYDGTSLTAFTNNGGIVDNSLGNPQPAFTYGNSNYSYNSIALGKFFQRITFDVYLNDNTTFDMFFATDAQGSGSYLSLTSDNAKTSGISSSLDWLDFNEPSATSSFGALDSETWHSVEITFDYLDNVMYASVYVDDVCRIYYYLIPDTNMFYGMSGDLSNGTVTVDNLKVFTEVTPPAITPTPSVTQTVTPTNTVTPTMTPTSTVTPTMTPTVTATPSVTATITATITPTVTVSPSVTTSASVTPTPSVTKSPVPSPTPTVTATLSVTPSITASVTASVTPTISITPSVTASLTLTPTPTSSVTPTRTPSPSITASVTSSVTPSITPTISVTPSVTASLTATPTPTPSVTPGQIQNQIDSAQRMMLRKANNSTFEMEALRRMILRKKT